MKVAGLFAGIGGLEAGLARAGHSCLVLNEILPAARAVLDARFDSVDKSDDVRAMADLPAGTELVAAGFPCQDLSQAGLTQGLGGQRSALVEEVFRLAARSRPRWILLENVPFMLQLGRGAAMRTIIAALEELGYLWAWRVVDTNGFGLPQRRERVYLLASRDGDPADVLMADDNPLERPVTALGQLAHGFYWTEGRGGLGWAVDAIPTLKNGSTIGIPSQPAILLPDGRIIKPDIRDAERMQGFQEDWTMPAERVVRTGMRWGLVGNAVSVPVAHWIGRRLLDPGKYDRDRDRHLPMSGTLPKAARFDGTRRHAVAISTDPLGIRSKPLATFLRHEGEPLSVRATAGFLSRTRVATLRFPPGFIAAVEAHLRIVSSTVPSSRRVA
ncbi:MAG: DNA cytosine methyltransferase [Methylobacterium sp.]|uniref:DNA cytosine methyltransferase n=1 Tax=Methylobacterium sp. TaxID=409 RepID=UPI0025D7567A|nr:DNA cytosine methyltransferase [Methylobacterium sp.]MBX9933344.1 DNA cytosine methyltransferase [Methylobacterium sp.]